MTGNHHEMHTGCSSPLPWIRYCAAWPADTLLARCRTEVRGIPDQLRTWCMVHMAEYEHQHRDRAENRSAYISYVEDWDGQVVRDMALGYAMQEELGWSDFDTDFAAASIVNERRKHLAMAALYAYRLLDDEGNVAP